MLSETLEDIQDLLEDVGEELHFFDGIIKGIAATDVFEYDNNTSGQTYTFNISEYDYEALGILEEAEFIYAAQNSIREYTFKVNKLTFDMAGWVIITASYIGVENV